MKIRDVAVSSASPAADTDSKTANLGFAGILLKPVTIEKLQELLSH